MYCGRMVKEIISAAIFGLSCKIVTIEVDVSDGLPCMDMVGYLSGEVKEAKERVRVAIKNSGFRIPAKRITVNFAPANLRKDGNAYDLPIALGILIATGLLEFEKEEDVFDLSKIMILGELGLSGDVKPVKGILPILLQAKKEGINYFLVPSNNYKEATLVEDVLVIGVSTLSEACFVMSNFDEKIKAKQKNFLVKWLIEGNYDDNEDGGLIEGEHKKRSGIQNISRVQKNRVNMNLDNVEKTVNDVDFSQVQGQFMARRAAEIAAAGFHNLLMVGTPGAGKSMIAKRIPTIMPPMTKEESIEVSTIYSVAGLLNEETPLIQKRILQSPHHTVTRQALVGGGLVPRPGMISLAHRSVLFLDELPEFGRSCLDVLRQPLEDKEILIARNGGNIVFPADFMLVAAMNPCPCGYYPDLNRCKCTQNEVLRYQGRISGPMLDRFDLITRVEGIGLDEIITKEPAESSESIRNRVLEARERQRKRLKNSSKSFNSQLNTEEIKQYCALDSNTEAYLMMIYEKQGLSARGYYRVLKVARTIADLEGSEHILENHIAQAVGYHGGL